ncbi:hypothetical protein UA08_02264 [Talaromyces atroroseus]|uniref:Uncharacterized protein n=1 Tax=Talaromyces atroroseus TaxID=1441469 RepID=A0A225AYE5_TALAT|nr:hypothetical protein UA08_02264 [Talaromyces atroroseus]OKL62368.1 hypothetical protein UA08_02264 [Talaromyces atroroseus]
MDWTSMSPWDLGWDDTVIAPDLNWEQAWTIESSSPHSSSSSSFSPPDATLSNKDALLMLDLDMMSPHGSTTVHTHTQNQQHLDMQNSPPSSSLVALYQPSLTRNFSYHHHSATSEQEQQAPLELAQTLEPLLHVAVRSRKSTMVSMLLQHGAAAVGDQNSDGATALHVATELGDEAIVSLLLSYGADSSVRDVRGQDALHLAVSAGHTAIVKLMLDNCKMTHEGSC